MVETSELKNSDMLNTKALKEGYSKKQQNPLCEHVFRYDAQNSICVDTA